MPEVKESALNLIESLPADCSWDDIMYEIYVKKKVERGLQDVEDGRVVSHEDVKKRFAE